MKRIGNKVSYIRRPLARQSLPAAGLAAVSLILTLASIGVSYYTGGSAPLWAAAVGFSGILTAAVSVIYGIFSLLEKEKNYILSKISLAAAGVILFLWLIVIVIAA